MDKENFTRADEIDVTVNGENDLPDGWEIDHKERGRAVRGGIGYYIRQYESEHFLVDMNSDVINGESVHHVSLLKVKRGENGERLTAIGTGVYRVIGVEDGYQFDETTGEESKEAHKEAEQAAFQVAVDLMRDVNRGKYDHKKFSED